MRAKRRGDQSQAPPGEMGQIQSSPMIVFSRFRD